MPNQRLDTALAVTPKKLALVALFAAVLRIAAVLTFGDIAPEVSDRTQRYEPLAASLLAGEGFTIGGQPTARSPPLYPVVLAALFAVAPSTLLVTQLFLALVDAATCALFALLAIPLFGKRLALLVAVALALCPYYIYQVLMAGNDTVFFFVHAIVLCLWIRWRHEPRASRWALLGVIAGLATLTRPVSILLPAVFAFVLWIDLTKVRPWRTNWRRAAVLCLALGAGYCAALAPWTVRNWLRFERFIPSQDLTSQFDRSTVDWREVRREIGDEEFAAVVASRKLQTKIIRESTGRVVAEPWTHARRMASRLFTAWSMTHSARHKRPLLFANWTILVLAAIGIWLSRHSWRGVLPALVMPAYYLLIHTTFLSIFRYQLPAFPFLILFALVPLVAIFDRVRRRVSPSAA